MTNFHHIPQLAGKLTVYDFLGTDVQIRFEDGSSLDFKDAFYADEDDRKFCVVYTEHCGYHVFYNDMIIQRKLIRRKNS